MVEDKTEVCLRKNRVSKSLCKRVDPDQLASEGDNWTGSTLFAIKYVNLYQQPWSSNLIGWKLEMGVFIQQDEG